MNKLSKTLSLVLTVFISLGFCTAANASLIYDLVDHSDANHTLQGTITTDGLLGSIGVSNIIAWTVTVAGDHNFTFISTDANAITTDFGSPASVTATATAIIMSGSGYFALVGDASSNYIPQYRYNISGDWVAWRPNGSLWLIPASSPDNVFATASTVPAPATLALFSLGLTGLRWSRRKKA